MAALLNALASGHLPPLPAKLVVHTRSQYHPASVPPVDVRRRRRGGRAAAVRCARIAAAAATMVMGIAVGQARGGGVLVLSTVDQETQAPVPARLVLMRADGRQPRPRRTVSAGVGVVLDRQLELALPSGAYRFQLTRGPEYRSVSGTFTLEQTSSDSKQVPLPRIVDMRAEGWWSGDPAVRRSRSDLRLLMQSEDLHFVGLVDAAPDPASASAADRANPAGISANAFAAAAADDAGDAATEDTAQWVRDDLRCIAPGLLVLGGDYPEGSSLPSLTAGQPTSLAIRQALQHRAEAIIVENPFAWDLPIWLASGRIDAVLLMGGWLRLDRSVETVADGRAPTEVGYLGKQGPGRWAEKVYWRMLEVGLHVAPLGASGAAATASPIGYNRTYVWLPPATDAAHPHGAAMPPGRSAATDRPPAVQAWWAGALAGRSVVTNGPLLRPTLGGEPPGHRFTARTGEALEMSVELQLAVREPVDYLDVIHNAQVVYSARLDDFARQGGTIPPLRFERSGWVLVRVVTAYEDHWRAAVSAPWYIEFDGQPRVSAEAVEFFRQWLSDRERMLARLPDAQLRAHVPFVRAARAFWQQRAEAANAP